MIKVISILLLASVFATHAQTNVVDIDSTYFHPAASMYVHGDMDGASNLVTTGLSFFPTDGKLLRLKELLDQQQEQDQENQDQQGDEDQQQQQDEQQQDQNQPDDHQDQEQQENEDQQQQQNEETQPEPQRAEEMSQDEAEQLLDAMKQEEETKRMQLHPVMGRPVNVEKDW